MKMSATISLSLILMAGAAAAADRTWDGGGSDANWKTPANWDGDATYPSAGDALFFGGSAKLTNTNTLDAGTAVAGLTFNSGAGAFVLDGNGLTLDGEVRNLSANLQTVNLPLTLSGTRTVYGFNSAVKLGGVLGGTGGLWVSVTNSSLTLSGANTYEGVTTVSNGQLSVTHSSALGSTNGNTVVYCRNTGCLQLSGGIDLAEPITLSGQRPSYGYSLLSASGSNTLSGPLTRHNEIRLNSNGGATLAVIGGVIPSGSGDMVINSSGTIAFYKTPVNLGANAFYTDSGGLTVLGVAGNTWGDTLVASGTLRLDITNALPESTLLKLGVDYGPNGTLSLNGNNQTVSRLLSNTSVAGTRTVTSPTAATLTLNQNVNSTYNGLFAGAVSLVKNGTATIIVTNATSTTTGDLIVNTGAVVIAQSASFSALANATVNGGVLELRTSTGLADATTLRIADGAQVKINAGLMETVNRLFLNGVQQVSGTWGATGSGATHIDDAHFTGTGLLNVQSSPAVTPVNATWDAGGTDLLTGTTNNWAGDTLPAFDGTTYAIFGDAGTTATVSTAIGLYGLSFNRDANFTVAAGDGMIALGSGGLLAKPLATTSRSYTLAEDVTFTENQLWCITNNGAGTASVTVSGTLGDSNSVYTLTKYGTGALVLTGSNSYDGATTVKTGGVLRITHSYALGSTNGTTLVENGGWIEMSGGITVPEAFTLYGDESTGYGGVLRSTGGSNTVSGLILNGSRIKCLSGSLDLTGGATGGQFVLGADGNTFIRIAQKPVNIGGSTFYAHTGAPIILAVSNNVWGQLEVSGHYVRTDVDNALAPAGTITVGNSPTSGLNLNGTRQTIGRLVCTSTPLIPSRIVFSTAPATLTVDQNATSTYNGCITGAVTLIKQNTGSLILANTNTSYGAFCVSNGSLIVSSTGTFGNNCTNVFVGGSGTLALSNTVSIADAATVWMPSNGVGTAKIHLADGVDERVGWLYYGNKMQRVGTYGSSSSSAYHKDDTRFSGNGILRVLHDNSGTLIAVK
jgi:autotransporter-associated beta strand protein